MQTGPWSFRPVLAAVAVAASLPSGCVLSAFQTRTEAQLIRRSLVRGLRGGSSGASNPRMRAPPPESAGCGGSVVEGPTLAPALEKFRQSLRAARDTSSLLVVADFDRTITQFRGPDGLPCDECHDIVFDRCSPNSMWAHEVQTFWALTREKFGVMAEKPLEEQLSLTNWWWASANEMMLKNELNRAMIVEAVGKANTAPRPGAMSLLTECISEGIPVMIVSAGRTPQTRCAY